METEMLIDMPGAVVNGAIRRLNADRDVDSGTGNDYVIDYRRRRSADCVSVNSAHSQKQTASAISTTATYWRDVMDGGADKMAAGLRRCESCDSDVSMTSLPESLTSDNDVIDSPPCRTPTSTGNSMAETDVSGGISTSGHGGGWWSRDSTVRPPAPTATVGFSIADILRPDFGRTAPHPSEPGCRQQKETEAAVRRCPSYPSTSLQSMLSSGIHRSLVHPYTAAAAFCAAAVAAAAAGVQGTTASPPTHRPELLRQKVTSTAGVRRLTSSRDVTCHVINNNNNNNNNTKLRSRYEVRDDVVRDDVTPKTTPRRRARVELQTSPSTATTNRPEHSVLASPASQTSSNGSTSGAAHREAGVEAKQQPGSDDGSSPALVPLPWPAWVYCTRYSDRPSSGRQSKSCTPIQSTARMANNVSNQHRYIGPIKLDY